MQNTGGANNHLEYLLVKLLCIRNVRILAFLAICRPHGVHLLNVTGPRGPSWAPRLGAALTHDLLLVTLGEELHGGGCPPGSLQEPLTLRVLPDLPQDSRVSGGQGRHTHFVVFPPPGVLLPPALHHRRARMLWAGLRARRLGSSGERPLYRPFEVSVQDGTVVSVAFLVVRSVLGPFRGIHCFFFSVFVVFYSLEYLLDQFILKTTDFFDCHFEPSAGSCILMIYSGG